MNLTNTEPVVLQGAVVALVNSVIALLVLTGAFSSDVGAAVTLIAGNAVVLGGVLFARAKVTPVAPAPPPAPPTEGTH